MSKNIRPTGNDIVTPSTTPRFHSLLPHLYNSFGISAISLIKVIIVPSWIPNLQDLMILTPYKSSTALVQLLAASNPAAPALKIWKSLGSSLVTSKKRTQLEQKLSTFLLSSYLPKVTCKYTGGDLTKSNYLV